MLFRSIVLRLGSIFSYYRWSANIGSDISHKSFAHFTNLKYSNYKLINESEITNILITSLNNSSSLIYNYITLFAAFISSLGFIFTGLALNAKLFILIFLILLFTYTSLLVFFKKELNKIGIVQHKFIQNAFEFIKYSYGSFKDIKLENSSPFINNLYLKNEIKRRNKGRDKKIISQFPKILIEGTAILLIASVIKYLFTFNKYNPEIGIDILMISIILSRLLPVFQLIYSCLSSIKVCSFSVLKLKDFLENDNQSKTINFYNQDNDHLFNNFCQIELQNLGHSFNKNNLYKNLNFTIRKGDWIGITEIGRAHV
mgnify:CR=1 FL=1